MQAIPAIVHDAVETRWPMKPHDLIIGKDNLYYFSAALVCNMKPDSARALKEQIRDIWDVALPYSTCCMGMNVLRHSIQDRKN